jgi:SAM-dependent methyltransferase
MTDDLPLEGMRDARDAPRQSFPGDDRDGEPREDAPRTSLSSWDEAYRDNETPWDIGRPQPAIVRIAGLGGLVEPVLDSGCGSGEHALLAASMGLEVKGVDVSQTAIERARAKARQRGLSAEFLVGDVLALGDMPRLEPPFRTIIDTGCFHTFANADRPLYASSLASVTDSGAVLHLLCFSEDTPGTYGPRRVTQGEIAATFSRDWQVDSIEPDSFAVSSLWPGPAPSAWLARIVRR